MCKRAMLLLLALMTVPTFASAATYWQITATTSPTALKTNLTAARPANFGNYTTPGGDTKTSTKVTRNPYLAVDFDVAAPAGYAVTNVKVDGVSVGNAAGTYTVNKGTTLSHTVVAYYAAASYTLTTQAAAGGTISSSQSYSANGTVTATPSIGYTLKGLKIGATTYLLADTLPAGVSLSGDASGATYTFASGSYTVQGVFAVVPAAAAIISNGTSLTVSPNASVLLDATTSSSNVAGTTYVWTKTAGTFTTNADPKKITFNAPASGSATVTLTVNAAGTSNPQASIIITAVAANSSTVCLDCHNGTDGPNMFNPGTKTTTAVVTAAWNLTGHAANSVTCSSCHNPNNDLSHTYSPLAVIPSVCTTCHTATGAAATTAHTAAMNTCSVCHTINSHSLGRTAVAGTIADTHVSGVAYTANGQVPAPRAQFVSANVTCSNCHAGSNADILAEFKTSAHGDAAGEAWSHYDWRSASRAACQRCHNGTAFVAKLENVNDATNYFGATPPVAPGEVLNCGACHSDVANGVVRTASAYAANLSNGATISFPDLGKSNLCIRCHSGRETGDSVNGSTNTTGTLSFINSHYLSAGGQVFTKTGYEYAGQIYDTLGYHKNVGVANVFNTGTNGPCVTCHMSEGHGHTWDFVTKDGSGVITANNSSLCVNCHTNMDGAHLQASKVAFDAALEQLNQALIAKGIYFRNASPYFYTTAAGSTAYTTWGTAYGAASWKQTMGAAFNYNLLIHDPGAYAHNRAYGLKLIADSIDYLDNGVVDGSATSAASTALAALTHITVANDPSICATCHNGATSNAGAPALGADPGGSHATVNTNCIACHTTTPGGTITVAAITATGKTCLDCHASFGTYDNGSAHNTFYGSGAANCVACHTANSANHGATPLCIDCHDAGKIRPVDANHAGFPGYGTTNAACLACHSASGHPHGIKPVNNTAFTTACDSCHNTFTGTTPVGATSATGKVVVQGWYSSSAHSAKTCDYCHTTKPHGSTDFATTVAIPKCVQCHMPDGARVAEGLAVPNGHPLFSAEFQNLSTAAQTTSRCAACHNLTKGGTATVNPHAVNFIGTVNGVDVGPCLFCHSKPTLPIVGGSALENAGVRQISIEFAKKSHHIYQPLLADGVTIDPLGIQSKHCIVCHKEGEPGATAGTVEVNGAIHLHGSVALRNADDNTTILWNGGTGENYAGNKQAEYTAMDNFCMACHDDNGASGITAVLNNVGVQANALNPFGDKISNGYDQVARGRVVNVFSQFSTGNMSHHAVRGAKYSARTTADAVAAGKMTNTANSGAGTNGVYARQSQAQVNGQETLYTAGLFTSYVPQGATLSVADNSTFHCGDCHTVGQLNYGNDIASAGNSLNKVAIGAHGSANDYMLRNNTGLDTVHGQYTYVCFNCHNNKYSGYRSASTGDNGNGGSTATNVGYYATKGNGTYHYNSANSSDFSNSAASTGAARSSGNGTVTGIVCINCHNAGRTGFGGIHGGTGTYKSTWQNYTSATVQAVTNPLNNAMKATNVGHYRFMGGMGNYGYKPFGGAWNWDGGIANGTYSDPNGAVKTNDASGNSKGDLAAATNGGANADPDTGGCYTNGGSGGNGGSNSNVINGSSPATNWSGCVHHSTANGTTVGSTPTPKRVSTLGAVGRPLTY
jgi:trimeric autotransporter adhesin